MKIKIRKRPEPPAISLSEKEEQLNVSSTARQLIELRDEWKACTKCQLGCRARKHVVLPDYLDFNGTSLQADVLIIGEGPGESEDIIGKPFVGKAGILLRKAIDAANPSGLVIALNNLVACRPQDKRAGYNREPNEEEIKACMPRLERLIEIINPVAVVAAGNVPRHWLSYLVFACESDTLKGFESIKHPSYIERAGGVNSTQFDWYVVELQKIFELARSVKRV